MDVSYGVYIYAFPIQQAVTAFSLSNGWSFGVCIALSLALVLALAAVSWRWVWSSLASGVRSIGAPAGRLWLPARLCAQPRFNLPLPLRRNGPRHAAQHGQ